MKIGVCLSPSQLFEPITAADYIELPARSLFEMENADFDTLKAAANTGRIKTYAANRLTPNEMRLTGTDVDMDTIKSYCCKVFDRLAQLQVKMVIFGAGKSKSVPEGFSREKAWDQLFEIGAMFADNARQYGQTVAVEPLSYAETNIINTLEDAVFYTNTVNRDNFKYMVDFYHFDNNGQAASSLLDNSRDLVHAHIAAPKTRTTPQTDGDWTFVRDCLALLKTINYNGGLSFEGRHDGPGELNTMISNLKKEAGI